MKRVYVIGLCLFGLTSPIACSKDAAKDKANADEKESKDKSKADKSDKKDGEKGEKAEKKPDVDKKPSPAASESVGKKAEDPAPATSGDTKKSGGKELAGVTVPAWSKPVRLGGCKLPAADDKKIQALQSGNDGGAGYDDGKGEIAALITSLKSKTCPGAYAVVSQALNVGGYLRYNKKAYTKADGWFARALVADPTNTFARYNLACNLALEGKTEDALWNLEQIVEGAKAGDLRALYYLDKANFDSDLKALKKEARFVSVQKALEVVLKGHTRCASNPKDPSTEDGIEVEGECRAVCASLGSDKGCANAHHACNRVDIFGDGVVPYCGEVMKCEGDLELSLSPVDESGSPLKGAKLGCHQKCIDNGDCPSRKCSWEKKALFVAGYSGYVNGTCN